MSIENKVLKDFEVGLLAIILSFIFSILVYFVSIFTKAYPPSDVEIIVNGVVTIPLYEFSPLTLSFIFISILDLSAFYRLRHGLRMLNLESHYGTAGLSLLIISSVFLLFGNIGLLLSDFMSSITNIVVLAWVAFMIVSLVFGIAGTLLLGLEFRNLGNLYKNNQIKNGAMLIISVILSYIGYILAYIGIRKMNKLENPKQQEELPSSQVINNPLQQNPQIKSGKQPIESNKTPKQQLSQVPKNNQVYSQQQKNVQKADIYGTQSKPNIQPSYQPIESVNILGNGTLKGDGTVYLNLTTNSPCTIVSAKIDSLPYPPVSIQPQNLQVNANQQVIIKFDKIAVLGLLKGKEYDFYLTVKVGNNFAPDQIIKIRYEPS